MAGIRGAGANLLVAILGLYASSGWSQNLTPVPTKTPTPKPTVYRVALVGEVRTLDPALISSPAETTVLSNLVEPLFERNFRSGELVLGAAKGFDWSNQGLTLTLKIKPDLKWSNGLDITANDFVYAWRRILNPSRQSPLFSQLQVIRGVSELAEGVFSDPQQLGIRAVEKDQIEIRLSQVSSSFLELLSQPSLAPVPREVVERYGEDWSRQWVGNGPFVPVHREAKKIILKKNPHYRLARRIRVDEVHVHLVAHAGEGEALFRAGRVHQFGQRDAGVPKKALSHWVGKKELLSQPDFRIHFLRLNTARAPVSQLKLRQAIAMAIDRGLLRSGLPSWQVEPTFSLIPEGIGSYRPARGYLYNPTGGRRIFRRLGYCGVKSSSSCKPSPHMVLLYPDDPRKHRLALAIKGILNRELGLEHVRIEAMVEEDFVREISRGEYLMALDELAVAPELPFGFLYAFRAGEASSAGYADPVFDQLLAAAESAIKSGEAENYHRRAESLLLREGGIVPLFNEMTPILLSTQVGGFTANVWDQHPFKSLTVEQ